MEHGLPATEIGLFGVKCPYCGKSDQIRKLESPDDLKDLVEEKELAAYSAFLKVILPPDRSIGVCRFCRNCLILNGNGQAEPLEERL
jgi:hypothetical protein